MEKRIPLATPHMSDEGFEQEYIKEAFDTNWIAPLGANVTGLEEEICKKVGAKEAVSLSAGTAAIHLALKLAGVKAGDRVFCQDLTFSATANPIIYENAVPVFIDSEYETWNMSPVALEKAFEKYPDTKYVIMVHLYGIAADINKIKEICKKYDAILIEDAAESLGTIYGNQYTGNFGDYGIFSFNGNKIITTSGGGMLISNRDDAKEKMAKATFWATQARDSARHYQHSEIGYNYRMSNIVAGIGRGQLKVLDNRVDKKREIFDYYTKEFAEIEEIQMMPANSNGQKCNCWLSAMALSEGCKVTPLEVQLALEKENIESRPVWKPMHMQPVFADYDYIDNGGVAEALFDRGVCLPSDTKMTEEEQQKVCDIVKGLFA